MTHDRDASADLSKASRAASPQGLPQDWPKEGDRRISEDGTEIELRTRLLAFDPRQQALTQEICARAFEGGREVARETYSIDINLYSRERLEAMLESAGFRNLRTDDALEGQNRRPGTTRSVFLATA